VKMKRPLKYILSAACVVALWGMASLVQSQDVNQGQAPPPTAPQPDSALPPPAGAATDKIVEQTRGPLNQGFAEMTSMTPQPSPPVDKQPPNPINEEPPDAKPDNPDAAWVPGYWSWNGENNNFLWVSGSWRVPPPGHRWIPGYWSEANSGYQWVSGFWTPEEVEEVTYLPAPPSYRDEGVDMSNPPDADHFWVPGFWAYRTRAYEWQPGYWSRVVANWMWIPAHYEWTPYGYVFTAGHWDYPLAQRGMLFTPVAFTAPIYQNASFVYTPQYLVALNTLVDNLFVAPGYQTYYFGDYYGTQYAGLGIYPWFNVGVGPYLYDPIFAYRSSLLWRKNPHWRDDFRQRYDRLVRDPALRPPRTWADYHRLVRGGKPLAGDRMVALPLRDALRDKRFNEHIVRVPEADRRALRTQTEFHRNQAVERRRLERANTVDRQPERRPGERVPRPEVRPGERPGERPVERPVERPDVKPEIRPEARPDARRDERTRDERAEVPRAPRTLRLPNRGPEAGRGEPRPEERRETPRTPNARPETPRRVNTPRPPQPDRAVRTPAARPAPERGERERK
jgi:WXXGXW repeat (2 copies)